jgi:beta-mannosidase
MATESVTADLLADASWTCCSTIPGGASDPAGLVQFPLVWFPVSVPGTAASALRDAGAAGLLEAVYDTRDWWFRCEFNGLPSTALLRLDGLATVADAWLNGEHLCHTENMLVGHEVDVTVGEFNELFLRCAALKPLLDVKRPRPRWKTRLANHQGLRWFRTTLLGRQPGWTVTPPPVGPWRPVRIEPRPAFRVVERRVHACCDTDGDGLVDVTYLLRAAGEDGSGPADQFVLRVGDSIGPLVVEPADEHHTFWVSGSVRVPNPELWWPHTHGPQPLYRLELEAADGVQVEVGHVGFRSVTVDRTGGGFTLSLNGDPVFCRGAGWFPIDPVSMVARDEDLRHTLSLVCLAGMNMVRIPGGTVYEDQRFWDLCDELGIMVWQDCMLGYLDPPDDAEFTAAFEVELVQVLGGLGGRPSLTVLCGGQELEEQAAMFGLARDKWSFPFIHETIPLVVERMLPGIPYVSSSPSGGDLPFRVDVGVSHYWGVGTFLRPLDDARRANVRFVSECLAFGVPPERQTVDEACGGAVRAGHDPDWKRTVHHDTSHSLDLEDVCEFYVQELFGVNAHMLRQIDPERSLDLGRAATAEVIATLFTEWRRPGSPCAGTLMIALRDLMPGPGWGIIDALGRPKAPWFLLRRVLAPIAVLITDEGVNGLRLHLMNDGAREFAGSVQVSLFQRGEILYEVVSQSVTIPARGAIEVEATAMFDGFRDLGYVYRYGPLTYDVISVALLADGDEGKGDRGPGMVAGKGGAEPVKEVVSETVWLPGGCNRPIEVEIGLTASARRGTGGTWDLEVATRRFAQSVVIDVPGWRPLDSWFHLVPGGTRSVRLFPEGGSAVTSGRLVGEVRALNLQGSVRIVTDKGTETEAEEVE